MMHRHLTSAALAFLLLAGPASAQEHSREFPVPHVVPQRSAKTPAPNLRSRSEVRSQSLDDIMAGISSPEQAQLWVDRNIEYVRHSSFVFGNESNELYNRVPAILEKKAGNCKEGFVLIASMLHRLGYDVAGLAFMPEHGDGHIIAIYNDLMTGKFGSAGISAADFTPPVYNDFESVATDVALQHLWTRVKVSTVDFDEQLYAAGPQVRLAATTRGSLDLSKSLGVSFESKRLVYGDYQKNFLTDGITLSLNGALIPYRETRTGTMSTVTSMHAVYYAARKVWQVSVDRHDSLTRYTATTVFFDTEMHPTYIGIYRNNPLNVSGEMHGYMLPSADDPARSDGVYARDYSTRAVLSKADAELYIRLGQSALELLQARDAQAQYAQRPTRK